MAEKEIGKKYGVISIEDGYLIIANFLVEIMCSSNFNATQLQVLLFIVRFTYGFKRDSHKMSISFISNGTGISKRSIGKELRNLIKGKVIHIAEDHTATESRELSINKYYGTWIGYGSRVPLWDKISTVEPEFHSGVEPELHSGIEPELHSGIEPELHKESKTKLKIESKTAYTVEFETFYKIYPYAENKEQTFKNWKNLLKKFDPEILIECAEKYKKSIKDVSDKKYITRSYNFLKNKGKYLEFTSDTEDGIEDIKQGVYMDTRLIKNDYSTWQ